MPKIILTLAIVAMFIALGAPVANAGINAVRSITSALAVADNAPAHYETHKR